MGRSWDDKDEKEPYCVLVHRETKWISTGKSIAMAHVGGKWDLIADDFTEEEANRYVRLNWKDRLFTPYEQAKDDRARGLVPYVDMTDDEFEALFYRMTKEEYLEAARPEVEKEAAEKAAKEAHLKEQSRMRNLDCTGVKVLYLYGYGQSAMLVEAKVLNGIKQMLPNAQVEVLEGFVRLTERKMYANIEDNNIALTRMGVHEGVPLYCYAPIEVPPVDPNDFTAYVCENQGVRFAKPAHADMQKAVDKTVEHIVRQGGYDLIMGFSCGGEVVSMVMGRLEEINRRAAR